MFTSWLNRLPEAQFQKHCLKTNSVGFKGEMIRRQMGVFLGNTDV